MSWNYTRSKDRIQKHLDNMGEITFCKLTREADLHSLLSETNCREIYGAHTYVDISNFDRLASEKIDDQGKYKGFIRLVHIYQREVGRIVEDEGIFDGVRIHFQGPKVHVLFYRPISNAEKIAAKAVLLQLVLKDFVANVLNPAFPTYDNFSVAGGSDIGDTIGTKNGRRGDRELLFLGAPANYAAKIIGSHGHLRVTKSLYDELPEDLQDLCEEVEKGGDVYEIKAVTQAKLDELTESYEIGWDREASKKRIEADKEQFALEDIAYSSANVLINVDDLSIYNNKRVKAASVFGDVTGFTAFIDAAVTDAQKKERLRILHAIRKEMATVAINDFNGIRIQFQGDRVQAIFHLPKDDSADIATEAVDAAVGLQSSIEKSIKDCLPAAKELHLAAGVDMDTTLVTKLGTRDHRDRICLGEPVQTAARYEERCEKEEIGTTKAVYDELPDRLKTHFSWSSARQCYLATGLTADVVENAQKAAMYTGQSVYVKTGIAGAVVTAVQQPAARAVTPSKPYADKNG